MKPDDRRPRSAGWPRANLFALGSVIGGAYEVRELASRGRLGQIFVAHDRNLGRDVTIKAMWPELDFAPLRREARALAGFQHPGLLAVYGFGVHDGIEYVVYERLVGVTLDAHLAKRADGGFTLAEVLETLIRICDALAAIHDAGLAHDDLRPENVLLAGAGRVVLFELGVVHREDVKATRQYLAPEAVGEAVRDAQLRDIYALGVIAFELLAGALPNGHDGIAAQLAARCATLPPALVQLVGEMVVDAPSKRPRRAAMIGARLRALRVPARGQPLSIVVADDDPDIRSLLGAVIRRIAPAARLRFAADGAEALKLVQRDPPDVLFLDLQMPEMTGLEVCMYLSGTSLADQVTICVLSQFGEPNRAILHNLGVVETFVKNQLSPEDLVVAIGKLLWRLAPESAPIAPPIAERADGDPEAVVGERYVLERQLGKGGMGQVFVARHTQLDKKFALKVLNRTFANEPEARARFIQEAKLASEIAHPNLVSVVDFGEDPRVGAYMVMELIAGESLSQATMTLRRACDILGQVADALATVHRHGIVHGDVKAENILLVDDVIGTRRRKVARLLDFGLAHRITQQRAATTELISGTPHYLAPERALGESATIASDIYALGVLGYLLITGSLPFDGAPDDILRAHVEDEPAPLAARRGEPIDPALEALIRRALHKDFAQRHPSMSAFRYELNAVMDMLDLRRKRVRATTHDGTTEARLAQVFTDSSVAQAVIADEDRVAFANDAFRALAREGTSDALATLVAELTDLPSALARARATGAAEVRSSDGRTIVRLAAIRGQSSDLHLMCWTEIA